MQDPSEQKRTKKQRSLLPRGMDGLRGIELVSAMLDALADTPGLHVVDRLPALSPGAVTCTALVLLDGATSSSLCTSLRSFDKAAQQGIAKLAKTGASNNGIVHRRTVAELDGSEESFVENAGSEVGLLASFCLV
jgi:hypothetical protein